VGPAEAKRALRRELLAHRRALPLEVVAAAAPPVVTALRALPELAGPHDVLLYAADPDEVTLDALLREPPLGWRVLLPRVDGGTIVAVPHAPGAPLVTGHRGVREPAGPPVDLASIRAVVVPGVAFTPDGARLGRGAGHYDRLLPHLAGAVRIGVCMEAFVRATLPVEPHDAVVDLLVTDAALRRRTDTAPAVPT
jgi:5-formyltetrahydrofolate cyclo-ligase